jgi:protein involved in polysaccharide export with SLBB domain
MRFAKTSPLLSVLLFAVLTAAVSTGCNSTPRHNRRVYDRYAELVAERNRALQNPPAEAEEIQEPAPAPAKPKPAPAVEKPAPAKPKPAPAVEKTAPAKPKPAPAVEKPAPPPPAPVEAPPVQVIPPAPPAPPPVEPPPPAEAAAPAPAAAPGEETDGTAYAIKVGDMVQIFLRGIPNAEAIESIVDENGMITMPFINEVRASGQTPSELGRMIRQIYQDEGIYRNMSVNVLVPTRYYFVQGEIRQPGRYQIMSATRLSQAIAGAGGYTEFASGRVVIKRGGKIVKTVRNARRLERTPGDNIMLEPDDIVEVQRSRW